MIGEKLAVIMYINPVTFSKIEEMRGDVSRSKFVGKIVEKTVTEIFENNPGSFRSWWACRTGSVSPHIGDETHE